jgi:DMSO/TMAO reductase YedYZ molybdopterin-dependent catalytic subunit
MRTMKLAAIAFALTLACGATAHEKGNDEDFVSKTVTVGGLVKNPMVLNVEALKAMPVTEFGETEMRCSPDRVKYVAEGYRGVLLRDILEAAQVDDDVRHSRNHMYVVVNATDNYPVVFSLHEIRNTPVGDEILVFFEKNGAPLGAREGQIALISAGDTSRCGRHVRWLNSIDVHRHEVAGR